MAAVLDQLTIATQALHPDLNRELLSRESPALRLLQENAVRKGGSPIKVKVRYKRNNGGWYSGYDKFDTDQVEQLAEGSLEWKNVYVNVTIDEDTLVKNAGMNIRDLMGLKDLRALPTRQRECIINIFGEQMKAAIEDMRDLLAKALYDKSPGSKQMESFYTIIDNDSTYAGIGYTELGKFGYKGLVSGTEDYIWAAKVDSNGGTLRSLDLDMVRAILSDCSVGASKPKWAFCGRDAYGAISLLLEGQKVRQNDQVAEIGFTGNIEWVEYGVTFIEDPYCDLNTIFFVNPDHLKLYIHPALDFVFTGFKEPVDQAAITGQIKAMVQLWCDDRAKQGRLEDVQP